MAAPCAATCTFDTCPAAEGIAEPTMTGPAPLSARIAGIMIARPMRMSPSMALYEVSRSLLGIANRARRRSAYAERLPLM
jgi:hypothetical protein